MTVFILDDVNKTLGNIFKARDVYDRFLRILSDIGDESFDSSASSTINDSISSARSWNENGYEPTDTIDMCQNTANKIIRALRKDTEYCEQQHEKCKGKNGWQTAGAVGMGILGAVTLFTIPILGIAAAGAAGAMGGDAKDTVEKSKQHLSYVSDRNSRFISRLQSFISSL